MQARPRARPAAQGTRLSSPTAPTRPTAARRAPTTRRLPARRPTAAPRRTPRGTATGTPAARVPLQQARASDASRAPRPPPPTAHRPPLAAAATVRPPPRAPAPAPKTGAATARASQTDSPHRLPESRCASHPAQQAPSETPETSRAGERQSRPSPHLLLYRQTAQQELRRFRVGTRLQQFAHLVIREVAHNREGSSARSGLASRRRKPFSTVRRVR